MAAIEIGLGKSGRRSYSLDEISLLPGKRTRGIDSVDISWNLDAYTFDLPFMASALDSVVSPETAVKISQLGGMAVLDLEGLWARFEDASSILEELAGLENEKAVVRLRQAYETPVDPDLVSQRVDELQAAGVKAVGAVSPKHVIALDSLLKKLPLDLLVVRGTVISAEHVSKKEDTLNLKKFVRELETPVVVGGCTSYQAALHLMRTGAAAVLVGVDSGITARTGKVTGIGSGMATAISDVRAARMRHLDETGVYVHIVADGGFVNSGQIVKAVACGADAVMLGGALAKSVEAPGRGWHWSSTSMAPTLPLGSRIKVEREASLEEILLGPASVATGELNLFGGLRRAMATLGFETLKELQKADVMVVSG